MYDWWKRYEIYYRNVNGEIEPYLEVNKDTSDKDVVPEQKIFEIIYNEHNNIKGVSQTKIKIRERYHSITEWMVNIFIQQICPVCAVMRNKPKKKAGAHTPIKSKRFRTRGCDCVCELRKYDCVCELRKL